MERIKDTLIFICNFTPVVYYDFKVGVPYKGDYIEVFNTDKVEFGGSNQINDALFISTKDKVNNKDYSIKIKVPPMAVSILSYKDISKDKMLDVRGIIINDSNIDSTINVKDINI